MSATTAPTHPSRNNAVTMAPLMIMPAAMEKKARIKLIPSRDATIDPVQAPVQGKGIATNTVRPILSYFSTVTE